MANSVNSSQLHEGAMITVTGYVQFSRIGSVIEGEELKRSDERRSSRGAITIGKEHTALTLRDPKIVPQSGNPDNLTIDELYIQEHFYKGTSDQNTYFYGIINRGRILPDVYAIRQDDKTKADKVDLDGKELARGLKVSVIMVVFNAKAYNRKGVGIKLITVNEPIRFYEAGSASNNAALAAMGLVTTGEVVKPDDTNTEVNKNVDSTNPINDPIPGQQFNSQPIQTNEPWVCAKCGNTNDAGLKFCGECGAKRDEATVQPGIGNPYMNQNRNTKPAGIRYDPNSTDRNY